VFPPQLGLADLSLRVFQDGMFQEGDDPDDEWCKMRLIPSEGPNPNQAEAEDRDYYDENDSHRIRRLPAVRRTT